MAKITVETELNTKGFKAGLDKLAGEASAFTKKAEEKFTIADIGKKLLRGFIGFEAVDKAIEGMKEANDELQKTVELSKKLNEVEMAGKMAREGSGRREEDVQRQLRQAREDQLDAEQARDKFSNYDPNTLKGFGLGVLAKVPLIGAAFAPQVDEFKSRDADAKEAQLRAQKLSEDLKTSAQAKALHDFDTLQSFQTQDDELQVKKGQISGLQSAQNKLERAAKRAKVIDTALGPGEELDAALLAVNAADTGVFDANAAANKEKSGARPAIFASSLAQLGGGGSVNVFGGSGAMLGEAKTQTALLRQLVVGQRAQAAHAGTGDITR